MGCVCVNYKHQQTHNMYYIPEMIRIHKYLEYLWISRYAVCPFQGLYWLFLQANQTSLRRQILPMHLLYQLPKQEKCNALFVTNFLGWEGTYICLHMQFLFVVMDVNVPVQTSWVRVWWGVFHKPAASLIFW